MRHSATDQAPRSVDAGYPEAGTSASERVEAIWREHRRWVAAVLYAHMPRGTDVDDLLQEVAVNLLRHIDSLDDTDAIAPWLRTVAVNVARDAGRRHKVRHEAFQSSEVVARLDRSRSGDNDRARSDAADRGRHALELIHELATDYREPLLLNLRGLSYRQISDVLGLPVSTIETRLFRARAMVREELLRRDRESKGGPVHPDPPRTDDLPNGGPFPFSTTVAPPGRRINHD